VPEIVSTNVTIYAAAWLTLLTGFILYFVDDMLEYIYRLRPNSIYHINAVDIIYMPRETIAACSCLCMMLHAWMINSCLVINEIDHQLTEKYLYRTHISITLSPQGSFHQRCCWCLVMSCWTSVWSWLIQSHNNNTTSTSAVKWPSHYDNSPPCFTRTIDTNIITVNISLLFRYFLLWFCAVA